MNSEVMVDPGKVPGEHDVFLCGEDAEAKRQVGELLESFGWPAERIRDVGGISSVRGTEMYVPCGFASGARSGPATSTSVMRLLDRRARH